VLEKGSNDLLILVDLSFVFKFIRVEFAVEFLNLFFFLSKYFELGSLFLSSLIGLTRQFILNFFELALVLVNDLPHF